MFHPATRASEPGRTPERLLAGRTPPSSCGAIPLIIALAAAIFLCGCVSASRSTPASQVVVPTAFEEPVPDGRRTTDEELARWWTVWQDSALEQWISDALKANTDIRVAQLHVVEARSLVTAVESALYPRVAAGGGIWGAEADWRLPPPPSDIPPGWLPSVSHGFYGGLAGLGASWEPDVFGGHRADATAARAMAVSAIESLNGARMIVVADVVENYQEARGLQLRLSVLDRGIATLEQLLNYVQARYQAGQALAFDVDQAREQLEGQLAKRAPLLALIEVRRRRLAVLAGKAPESAAALPPPTAFTIPPPPVGIVPVQMLERRPDVQARAAQVQACAARLTSARKDLLPRFGIQFLGGDGELHFDGLPGIGATGGLINLTAYLPVFTAGRVRANIAASDARLNEAFVDYDATVLKALEDVENAYRFRNALDQSIQSLAAALAAAQRSDAASTALYEGGRKTLRDVLESRLAALNDEDDLVQTEMGRATATVQLYRALGGGW